jgi:hypothetical protein
MPALLNTIHFSKTCTLLFKQVPCQMVGLSQRSVEGKLWLLYLVMLLKDGNITGSTRFAG